jgi:peptide/nickel transport system substrate-binding protein
MMRTTRVAVATTTAIALALGATACDGSGGKFVNGGTLIYYAPQDFDHLDPQRDYTTEAESLSEELVRTLTNWSEPADGSKPKLVGDLATDTGTPSDGDRTWTFHLRPGIRYQDGTPVTAGDIKYGVERQFSPDINGGPPYASQWLIGGDAYKGPYSGQELNSIETPDPSTIIFHLNQPVVDFNQTTTMPGWSAVPKSKDTGPSYDTHVWADGPYMMKSYSKGKELVLARNPNWSRSTDPIREQNVNEIDVKMGMDRSSIDRLIQSDGPSAKNSVQEYPIAGADLAQIAGDPYLKERYHKIHSPGINYMAINTTRVTDIRVRQAIEYAINKRTARGAFGGAAYGGYASTMLAPGVDGHKDFNLYATNPAGDLAKAKALMAQAGNPRLTMSLSVEATPTQENFADTVKASLARIGITVNITPIDQSNYFSIMDNVKNQYDLSWMDWIPDWPNASTVLPLLFDGRRIAKQPQSNQDISYLNDPAINTRIDTIAQITDPAQANAAYGDLDEQIMQQAAVVPLFYMDFSEQSGSKVGALVPDPVVAELNLAHVYVKQ